MWTQRILTGGDSQQQEAAAHMCLTPTLHAYDSKPHVQLSIDRKLNIHAALPPVPSFPNMPHFSHLIEPPTHSY